MSVRFLNNNSVNNTDVVAKSFPIGAIPTTPWVRNPSWSPCEANSGDNRVRGLYAVFPSGANFIAMTVAGAYTVNYGDGTTTNYGSGVQANYEYDYANANLVGTEAPVTFTDAGDLVTRTAHGYTDGMRVQFFNITTTTGIVNAQFYFVINSTANTFQVSATEGGSALALTNDGTGQLLPYRIATVTITPQGGSNLTSIDFFIKHTQTNLQAYCTGWLDLAFASSTITSLTLGGSTTIFNNYIERVRLNQLGSITSLFNVFNNMSELQNVEISNTISTLTSVGNMFAGCTSLKTVPLFNTASVSNMGAMFSDCRSLQTVPLFNTASVNSINIMFQNCNSLETVPLFNTAAVTNMTSMFSGCTSLKTVPIFNTAAVTNMTSMFSGCSSLQSVPLFNTAIVTNMSSMFQNCVALQSVPLFNTAAVTNMSTMFSGCTSLQSAPLFNTAIVTNMSSMFSTCRALQSVPLFNTVAVTNMSSMFQNCSSLQTVPLFNTAAVTNMSTMFSGCSSLSSLPALVTTAVTSSSNFGSMFNACPSLAKIEAKNFRFTFDVLNCKLSRTSLQEIYTNLPTTASAQVITVTGNYGVDTATTKSVTTTAQSTVVPMANTTGMVVGQFVTGTRTGITSGISVTSDVTANTLTLTAHGLTDGKQISFATLGTTTGITAWTIYFVVGATANTFQVALTAGGAAIDLTGTNGTLTARYPSFITSIITNVSVTLDTPTATTGTTTLTFRTLNSSEALLKNWTVTF